jgi:hypothetical protein
VRRSTGGSARATPVSDRRVDQGAQAVVMSARGDVRASGHDLLGPPNRRYGRDQRVERDEVQA